MTTSYFEWIPFGKPMEKNNGTIFFTDEKIWGTLQMIDLSKENLLIEF